MKTSRLPVAVLAVLLSTSASLAAASAVPFRALTLAAAMDAAAAEGKLVFIDFYTTWCGPCKMLDAQTWPNPEVGKLVGENAVALKLDAEKEGLDAAKRYKITAYPTLLMLRPDGSEVDRLIGFREAAPFLREFMQLVAMARSGKSAIAVARENVAEQARPDAVGGEPEDAQPHFDLAKKLLAAGKSEEALHELLWCWDEGKKDPEFSRMTRNQVPRELARLARDYPPAREAMLARRDQARERALANKGGTVGIQDLLYLNRELKMDDDTLAVFDQIPEGDRRRVTISIYLFDTLLEKQRYADAVLFNSAETAAMTIERAKSQLAKGGSAAAAYARFTIDHTAKRVEALAGAGKVDEARELGQKLLTLDATPGTKELLARHVTRAGHPELFKAD